MTNNNTIMNNSGVAAPGSIMLKNAKHEQFCREYIVDVNQAQAAIRAGYSPVGAGAQAYKLLRKPKIIDRIEYLLEERRRTLGVDAFWVVRNFMEIYDRCMQKESVMIYDKDKGKMVQKTVLVKHGDDVREEGVWEFDAANANRAMENIAKYLGMFIQKIESTETKQSINWNVDVSPFMQKPQKTRAEEDKEVKKINTIKKKLQVFRTRVIEPKRAGRPPASPQ